MYLKIYWIKEGLEQLGPFDVDDLRNRGIDRDVMVWYAGAERWTKAGDVPELKELFSSDTDATQPPPIKKWVFPKILIPLIPLVVAAGVIGVWSILYIRRTPPPPPPPPPATQVDTTVRFSKPVLVASRNQEDPTSSVGYYKQAVYATVRNDGASGKVFFRVFLFQAENEYEQDQVFYMQANETKEFHFIFNDADQLGGRVTSKVYVASAL